jgi:hypothetical protein
MHVDVIAHPGPGRIADNQGWNRSELRSANWWSIPRTGIGSVRRRRMSRECQDQGYEYFRRLSLKGGQLCIIRLNIVGELLRPVCKGFHQMDEGSQWEEVG